MKKSIIALCLGLIITICVSLYSDAEQGKIADGVLRLHVLANSDTREDQALKLAVRDRLLLESRSLFMDCETRDASREVFLQEKARLEAAAADEIREQGFQYPVSLSLEKTYFPTRYYDGIAFPAGEYDAVRVEIGKAEGQNWWCVMFPPLCFVDGSVSADSTLGITDVLGTDTALLTPDATTDVQVRFKVVDLFQSTKHMIRDVFRRT